MLGGTHGTPGKFACSHESFVANNLRAEGGETDGDELASRGDASKQAMYDTVLTTSVEVNGEPVRVRVGESIAIAHP